MLMFDGHLHVLFNALPPNSQLLFSEIGITPLFREFVGPVAPQGCVASKRNVLKI